MKKKFYYINDGKYIFMRFNTSAFGSKWCGLWHSNKKLLDYYAIKINNEWLSPGNCYRFVKINNMAEHFYRIGELKVKEKVVVGNGVSININVKSKNMRKVKVVLETGINMRKRCENSHSRKYKIKKGKTVEIKNKMGSVKLGKGKFHEKNIYKNHFPGKYHDWDWEEEEQSVFVPGSFEQQGKAKKSGTLFKFYIQKPAEKSSHKGFYQKNRGFFAGFPWFLQVWGRDSGFVIPAYADRKKFDWCRNALRKLASYEKFGKMPNFIENGVKRNSIDSPALFVTACEHYIKKSKDLDFKDRMESTITSILNSQRTGMIKSGKKETWMDTLDRQGYNIDVQSVWAAAFRSGYKLYKNKNWAGRYEFLRKKINNDFWDKDYFKDSLEKNKRTANPVFALFFNLVDKKKAEKCFEILESPEFLTSRGLRSLSNKDPCYNPKGYHTGMVWGLLTGMLAYAERIYKRKKESEKIMKIIKKNKSLRCVQGIDEVYNGNTLEPKGCCSQAWSEIWETRINSEF